MCSKDAAHHSRSKLIERDAATNESIVFPYEDYEKTFLMEIIKSKLGEDILKYGDSFREIVQLWKTDNIDENDTIGSLPPITHPVNKYLRRDTILNIEKGMLNDIVLWLINDFIRHRDECDFHLPHSY